MEELIDMIEEARDEAKRLASDAEDSARFYTEYYPIGDGYCTQDFMDEGDAAEIEMYEDWADRLEYILDEMKEELESRKKPVKSA